MATFQKDQIREVYQNKYPDIFGTTNNNLVHFIAEEIADLKILVDTSTQGGLNAQGGPIAVLGDATAPGEEGPLLARVLGDR